jgi:N6-adenosine-specific RNA methylase IME4
MRVMSERYRTIVADPPWPIGDFPQWFASEKGGTVKRPYDVMTLDEIKALPIREMSDNVDQDAHLYLWTIDQHLEAAFGVARAWGFHHSATLVWCKPQRPGGLGGVFPSNCEYVLFCRRPKVVTRPDVLRVTTYLADAADRSGVGRREVDLALGTSDMAGWWLSRIDTRCACPSWEQFERIKRIVGAGESVDDLVCELNARKGTAEFQPFARADGRWFQWPVAEHSRKPEAFLDLVEQVSPGPRLEMFSRRARLGWDTWGDEALGGSSFAAALDPVDQRRAEQ